ncbi:hypothetical protein XBP1_270032 [Xenorhabdus bovienii str. puntauvense]|uniref:Uncharacterized protein n=3 Tax=Xenorhabdus bovienii TaxID=40576 RepID=A0A0B6XBT1_XENBV|nr:hypothetical protein XBFFR1_1910067 [Xenorhabdus bovienii str. feltiae France]CDG94546.1 hypothetical protein XBFFL1_770030 [Xenorhabdus bovienii str. feltiae Florida]CDG97492.1 hypothetical protein XBP1_270032 [Xenorhabdus bovienii str. puntauvense]CDH03802.1 hypothetical protein XBFM1_850039 [Xenorhabdus bovienii str. feltiae Moldova]CDM89729.1 protein of unknown function [Xenorhabdus bovienii]
MYYKVFFGIVKKFIVGRIYFYGIRDDAGEWQADLITIIVL